MDEIKDNSLEELITILLKENMKNEKLTELTEKVNEFVGQNNKSVSDCKDKHLSEKVDSFIKEYGKKENGQNIPMKKTEIGTSMIFAPNKTEELKKLLGKKVVKIKEIRHSEFETTSENVLLGHGMFDNSIIITTEDGTVVTI